MIEWWEEAGTLGDADPVTLTAGAGQNVYRKGLHAIGVAQRAVGCPAIIVNDNRIDLNSTDNSTDETAFHIERSPEGTTWVEIGTVAANVTAYSDLTPVCGGTYHYRVRAFRSPDSMYSSYSSPDDVATSRVRPVLRCSRQLTTNSHATVHPTSRGWTRWERPTGSAFRSRATLHSQPS